MDINEITQNSRFYKAFEKSKYFRNNNRNHWHIKSGRFSYLPRFTKLQNFLLESLYTVSDLHNPSAYRLYLYLLRQITWYKSRSSIEYRPKKIKAELNMGNSFYKAERILKEKNMIRNESINDTEYIGLNPYPELWITDSKDRIDEIIDKEINELLGIQKDALSSSSSSSCSRSSSSSESYSLLGDEELLRMVDELNKVKPNKPKQKANQRPYGKFEPVEPELLAKLDNM